MTMGELYGEYNQLTQEWRDGIASSLIRDAVAANQQPVAPPAAASASPANPPTPADSSTPASTAPATCTCAT